MTDPDLVRFLDAQAPLYDRVLEELAAGRKTGHWMWFVFPQLGGLGTSPMARHYAIADLDQARRYLADPTLGARLRMSTRAMLAIPDASATTILGTPDDLKFRSCMTLFARAATDPDDRTLFNAGLAGFYSGVPDQRTLDLLGR